MASKCAAACSLAQTAGRDRGATGQAGACQVPRVPLRTTVLQYRRDATDPVPGNRIQSRGHNSVRRQANRGARPRPSAATVEVRARGNARERSTRAPRCRSWLPHARREIDPSYSRNRTYLITHLDAGVRRIGPKEGRRFAGRPCGMAAVARRRRRGGSAAPFLQVGEMPTQPAAARSGMSELRHAGRCQMQSTIGPYP